MKVRMVLVKERKNDGKRRKHRALQNEGANLLHPKVWMVLVKERIVKGESVEIFRTKADSKSQVMRMLVKVTK